MYIGDKSETLLGIDGTKARIFRGWQTDRCGDSVGDPCSDELPYGPLDGFHCEAWQLRGIVMNIALNPEATTDQSCETYRKTTRQLEAATLSAARVAETSVAQSVEAYERSKNALEAAVGAMARSFDALGQGAAAINRKIIEIAQQNVSSGFDLAKGLATATTLAEVLELRAAYWRKQFSALAAQAEEVRALSTKVAAEMTDPTKT